MIHSTENNTHLEKTLEKMFTSKLILCLVLLIPSAYSAELDTELIQATTQCVREAGLIGGLNLGLSVASITNVRKTQRLSSQPAKCARACVLKKLNLMDKDGQLMTQAPEFLAKLSNGKQKKLQLMKDRLSRCATSLNRDVKDPCERAYRLEPCTKRK